MNSGDSTNQGPDATPKDGPGTSNADSGILAEFNIKDKDVAAGMKKLSTHLNDIQTENQDLRKQLHSYMTHAKSKIPLPLTFDGSHGTTVDMFATQLETHQVLHELSDATMAALLPTALKDMALDWYHNQTPSLRSSYPAVMQKLRDTFTTTVDAPKYVKKLKQMTQSPHQSITEFASEIRRVAELANIKDPDRCSYFVKGLRDPLAEQMLVKDHSELHDAVKEARRLETKMTSNDNVYRMNNFMHDIADRLARIEMGQSSNLAVQALSNEHSASGGPKPYAPGKKPDRDTITCYRCKKIGHYSRECPNTKPKTDKYCTHCNMGGHDVSDCSWHSRGQPCPTCPACKRKGHTSSSPRCPGRRSTSNVTESSQQTEN